ncbi:MAG: PDZ domain-containing protein [Gammaproteobacteria bacterium]|nr:PDZ domain-containing protein [Gammaproteobacteria bacterium]
MKLLTTAAACILVLVGTHSLSAKEPQEQQEELDLASDEQLSTNDSEYEAQRRERALKAQQEAIQAQHAAQQAHEEAIEAQEEANRKSREAIELQEWHEDLLRKSEEATDQFNHALDALRSSREHLHEVSVVAPWIAASRSEVESIGNDLTYAIRNRIAATTGGFIGIQMGESTSKGIVIDEVVQKSPAEDSGLEQGDVIASVDGIDIRKAKNPTKALTALIQSVDPGSEVELDIVRGNKKLTVPVTVGTREQTARFSYSLPTSRIFGDAISIYRPAPYLVLLEFEEELGHYFGMEYGILVVDAPKDSKLQVGDVLLRIDNKPVRSISHAERFLRDTEETTEFTVKRRGKTQKIDIAATGLRLSDVRDM